MCLVQSVLNGFELYQNLFDWLSKGGFSPKITSLPPRQVNGAYGPYYAGPTKRIQTNGAWTGPITFAIQWIDPNDISAGFEFHRYCFHSLTHQFNLRSE